MCAFERREKEQKVAYGGRSGEPSAPVSVHARAFTAASRHHCTPCAWPPALLPHEPSTGAGGAPVHARVQRRWHRAQFISAPFPEAHAGALCTMTPHHDTVSVHLRTPLYALVIRLRTTRQDNALLSARENVERTAERRIQIAIKHWAANVAAVQEYGRAGRNRLLFRFC